MKSYSRNTLQFFGPLNNEVHCDLISTNSLIINSLTIDN
jgi:hypothetical protein